MSYENDHDEEALHLGDAPIQEVIDELSNGVRELNEDHCIQLEEIISESRRRNR